MADNRILPWSVFQSRTMRRVLWCAILLVLAVTVFCVADAWVERPKEAVVRPREPWLDDPAVVALFGAGFDLGGIDEVLTVRAYPPAIVREESLLRHLEGFKWLTTLKLRSQKAVTGAGLRYVAHLTRLQTVELADCSVDDRGLKYLENLSKMTYLGLSGCPVTNDGTKYLVKLQDLRRLDVSRTRISNEGLAGIGQVVSLRELSLDRTSITDEGLPYLAPLHQLRQLSLDDTRITDAGLKCLQTLPNLERLSLQGTRVTSAGLKKLQSLPKLKRLSLERTTVSLAEAREFRQTKQEVAIWLETGLLHGDGRWEPRPKGEN